MKIRLNTIYITYQGEINNFGIGEPVIFLRLQGCPIRCYKESLGILCDTPEALEKDDSTLVEIETVIERLLNIRNQTGISYICLTGGDPLWQNKETLHYLFTRLEQEKFFVSVETSGVIAIKPFIEYRGVFWVVDYKLKSAGVKTKYAESNFYVPKGTVIKFVVYDDADVEEMLEVVNSGKFNSDAKFTAGLYWGTTKMTYQKLSEILMENNLLGKISINFQTHKLAEFYDQNSEIACKTTIRTEI